MWKMGLVLFMGVILMTRSLKVSLPKKPNKPFQFKKEKAEVMEDIKVPEVLEIISVPEVRPEILPEIKEIKIEKPKEEKVKIITIVPKTRKSRTTKSTPVKKPKIKQV